MEGLLDILYTTVSEEKINRGKVNKIVELLKTTFRRFGTTIKDLTTFVEAENDTTDEKTEEINIFEVVENVKGDLTHLIEESNAKIEVIGQDKFLINIPKKNFRSIMYNLLSNAIKYRSSERSPEVVVRMEKVDGKILLSVTDNGLGIPSDKLDKVFTIFKRFHDHVEGSGLGLYIVKRMIDRSKGQIEVDSTLNKGTIFTIIF
jgi:signal transduction histidine kinase